MCVNFMISSERTIKDVRLHESATADKELPAETVAMETDDAASGDMIGLLLSGVQFHSPVHNL